MRSAKDKYVIATDDVRAGSEDHVVRYILGVSLPMAVVALSAIWITAALAAA